MNKFSIKSILSEILFSSRICESANQQNIVDFFYDRLLLEKLLVGEPVSVPELRKVLRNKILNFEFIKLDGEVRPAQGTTMMKYIPKEEHPSGDNPSSDKVAAFYDLSKSAWRSVSNRSDEIILVKDEITGKPKIRVSDKKPKEEPTKPEISKVPGVSQRPIIPKMEPVIKPSIKPEVVPPLPTGEEIPEPDVKEKPLDIEDPTITADDVQDKDIIYPESEIEEVPTELPTDIEVEDIMFPEEEEEIEPQEKPENDVEESTLPPKEDITFPETFPDDEEENL